MNMLYLYIFGFAFLGIGILFFTGRALRWVKGWQAMPESERAKIRIVPLCRNLSVPFFAVGALFLAGGLFPAFGERWLRWCLVAWMVLCWADLLYIDRSGAYKVSGAAKG